MPSADELNKTKRPYVATDIIIEYYDAQKNKEGIILITRKNAPYGLAIPGGFLDYGLTLEQNAVKEGYEETGLEEIILKNNSMPLTIKSDPNRDPRHHMVSVVYVAEGKGKLRSGVFDDAINPTLYSIDEVKSLIKYNGLIESEKLVFDHAKILGDYIKFRESL